jgi:serine protease Do
LGLPKPQGALVARVESGSPSEIAGVQPGDIIINFDNVEIEKTSDLPRLVCKTDPGTKSLLTVLRKGKKLNLPIIIAEMEIKSAKKENEKYIKYTNYTNYINYINYNNI